MNDTLDRNPLTAVLLLFTLIAAGGCETGASKVASPSAESTLRQHDAIASEDTSATKRLRLATTTSTRDSGLLDVLIPLFRKQHDCRVDVIAVGTGAALKLGEAGDVDVLIVHEESAEEAFIKSGFGTTREEFMSNNYLLIGPTADPAAIGGLQPDAALSAILDCGERFVSRGDDSGTHKRELQLWSLAGGRPVSDHYIETGQGMGPTLIMADQMSAYTLVDGGTFLKFRPKIELVPLVEHGDGLKNRYAVIQVNQALHRHVNSESAASFVEFLLSRVAQRAIADYRIEGDQLFVPTRLDEET